MRPHSPLRCQRFDCPNAGPEGCLTIWRAEFQANNIHRVPADSQLKWFAVRDEAILGDDTPLRNQSNQVFKCCRSKRVDHVTKIAGWMTKEKTEVGDRTQASDGFGCFVHYEYTTCFIGDAFLLNTGGYSCRLAVICSQPSKLSRDLCERMRSRTSSTTLARRE